MEYLAPRHAYTGGSDFTDIVIKKRQRSPLLRAFMSQFDSADNQLAFVDFMASMNVAPFGLVQLGNASPSQLVQYRDIVEDYSQDNMIEDFSRLAPHDRAICIPVQKQRVLKHIDQLIGKGGTDWSLGAAYFYLAGIYAAEYDYQGAILYYRQGLLFLIIKSPCRTWAACYERLKMYDKAVVTFAISYAEKALTIDPESINAYQTISIALSRVGKPAEALAYAEQGLKIDPDNAELRLIRNTLIDVE